MNNEMIYNGELYRLCDDSIEYNRRIMTYVNKDRVALVVTFRYDQLLEIKHGEIINEDDYDFDFDQLDDLSQE